MRSLRASLATASLLLLSGSTLSAQATRIACKDGSTPKVGHFTCWGHGGVVSVPVKKAKPLAKKPAAKAASKSTVTQAGKPATKKKRAATKARSRKPAKASAK